MLITKELKSAPFSPFKSSQKVAEKICNFIVFSNLFKIDRTTGQLGEYKDMIESKPLTFVKLFVIFCHQAIFGLPIVKTILSTPTNHQLKV
jgi:hypothetical protein